MLDFAGNILRHGPTDQVRVKTNDKNDEPSVAPVNEYLDCHELLHASEMTCPNCGREFPRSRPHGT